MQNITYQGSVAAAPDRVRGEFIQRTYLHLAGAVLVFIALVAVLLQLPDIDRVTRAMTGGYAWLLVLGAFFVASTVADRWARSTTSVPMQYLGLGLLIVAQAIIMLPLLHAARTYSDPDVVPTAALLTALLFAGLTAIAFMSGADFSFLRSAITIGSLLGLGLIVASILFGFSLGIIFAVAIVALASASILYQTSNILRTYRVEQHVAAALGLFSSVALLFWYVLRILMRR
jgi:FtsH-binding integral membrane protein